MLHTDAATPRASIVVAFVPIARAFRFARHPLTHLAVLSDARLKDVVATFDLGSDELLKLKPKIFVRFPFSNPA